MINILRYILRSRINLHTLAVFIVLVILTLQNLLSEDVSVGSLHIYGDLGLSDDVKNQIWTATKIAVFLPVSALWLLDWRRLLMKAVVVSNALLTFDLLVSTTLLAIHMSNQFAFRESALVRDTLLVMVMNLLIFSLWYWIIDSPRLRQDTPRESEPWDFLFPQRVSSISGYGDWIAGYIDYLFLAFITSFTFGPADTMPISQRAKILMIMQVSISVINIVVLAGYAMAIL